MPNRKVDPIVKYCANIERARRSFWDYCNVTAPDFYTPKRKYLIDLCDELQEFFSDQNDILIINIPPRFGKSRTSGKFVEWAFGQDQRIKLMTGSYNETLSTIFSKSVRDTIQTAKADALRIVYSDIFPGVKIKRGDGAMNLWALEGSGTNNYLATSPTGTATGFGADFVVIDDLIKNAYEANNASILNNQWEWFRDTIYSRMEGKRKILIVMTQWATNDLSHLAKEHFEKIGLKVKQISRGAVNSDGTMLDDEILSREQYDNKRATLSANIFEANYNNKSIDMIDRVYDGFGTYDKLPDKIERIVSRVDTADDGNDYLCKIIAARSGNNLYVLDAYYTQAHMEITEKESAKRDTDHKTQYCVTESNNGGKGFSRNVEREARALGNLHTQYKWEATTANKQSRILTNCTGVMNTVLFPVGWESRWSEFANALKTYTRSGKNDHDDAPDCLTALYEDEFVKHRCPGIITLRR